MKAAYESLIELSGFEILAGLIALAALLLFPKLRFKLFSFFAALLFAVIMLTWSEIILTIGASQPSGKHFQKLDVARTAPAVTIGAVELVQDPSLASSASLKHIAFQQLDAGDWLIGSISTTKRLSLRYADATNPDEKVSFDSSQFFLANGDEVSLQGQAGWT